jgi:hypothetical protein
MKLKTQIYYFNRIKELGLLNTFKRIQHRLSKLIYKFSHKQKALNFVANHSWKRIKTQNNFDSNFDFFFDQLKEKKFIKNVLNSIEFKNFTDSFKAKNFDLNHTFDWHLEFKNKKNCFSQDIKIESAGQDFNKLHPDIKSAWELSRFQHIYQLGKTYQETQNPNYAIFFQTQIDDWICNNPFLLGVNWFCPMEVGIRAINFIYGFYFFKNAKEISPAFWNKFVCLLYDHAKYLENNWETSDKPNNHYLSDLIGYFYLCFFFDNLTHFKKEKQKIFNKILKQFEHQVHPDGTCYEGSTNYHKLVTEIFLHFYLLCKNNNFVLPEHFESKLQKMFLFIQDCSDQAENLVQIGDNDSGKILKTRRKFCLACPSTPWRSRDPRFREGDVAVKRHSRENGNPGFNSPTLLHYPNFGLTIIKSQKLHLTFRHPTFCQAQPSGHFHQDSLAITLSIDGIQILVDPGTYVYTASATWRNFFRSAENHNTFHLKTNNVFEDLFQLNRAAQKDSAKILKAEEKIEIENYQKSDIGLTQHRKLIFLKQEQSVELQDWWQTNTEKNLTSEWNLVFHPDITLENFNEIWIIKHKNFVIAKLETNLEFKATDGFYSEKYGKIEKCIKLKSAKKIDHQKIFIKLNAAKT